ncbi:hypothetical protein EON65_50510 [archaeon]|nr:MAG: hypothetical protein EON65_50510 [archaeon]
MMEAITLRTSKDATLQVSLSVMICWHSVGIKAGQSLRGTSTAPKAAKAWAEVCATTGTGDFTDCSN